MERASSDEEADVGGGEDEVVGPSGAAAGLGMGCAALAVALSSEPDTLGAGMGGAGSGFVCCLGGDGERSRITSVRALFLAGTAPGASAETASGETAAGELESMDDAGSEVEAAAGTCAGAGIVVGTSRGVCEVGEGERLLCPGAARRSERGCTTTLCASGVVALGPCMMASRSRRFWLGLLTSGGATVVAGGTTMLGDEPLLVSTALRPDSSALSLRGLPADVLHTRNVSEGREGRRLGTPLWCGSNGSKMGKSNTHTHTHIHISGYW